jgi:hypothetical protein
MAEITPIYARQNTEQTTTSTTYVDASCETAALTDGVDYLVMYRGNTGASASTSVSKMRLVHDTDVIAEMIAESGFEANHYSSAECQGYARVTGDGVATLAFEFAVSAGTGYAGSMSIVAVPLDQLVENHDFFYSGTNSATLEVDNASFSVWVEQRSATFAIGETGDYLILMSSEGSPAASGGGVGNAARVRWRHDSADLFPVAASQYALKEWESDGDFFGFAFCGVKSLTVGDNTIDVECASRSTALGDYRRSRIWAIRANAFDQLVQLETLTGLNTTSDTFVDFQAQAFTPNQTEDVIALSATYAASDAGQRGPLMQMVMKHGDGCVNSGFTTNDGGFNASSDKMPIVMADVDPQLAAAHTYKNQGRSSVNTATASFGRAYDGTSNGLAHLIIWSMTLSLPPLYGGGETALGADGDLHNAVDGLGATEFAGSGALHNAVDGSGATEFAGSGSLYNAVDGEGASVFSASGPLSNAVAGAGSTAFEGDAALSTAITWAGAGLTNFEGSGSFPRVIDGAQDLSVKPFRMRRHDKPFRMRRHDKPFNMKRGKG